MTRVRQVDGRGHDMGEEAIEEEYAFQSQIYRIQVSSPFIVSPQMTVIFAPS